MASLKKNPRAIAVGLGLLWLAVQAALFFFGPRTDLLTPHFGVRYGNDTPRYLEAAGVLLSGRFPTGLATRSLGYNLFVAFFLWSGLGQVGIVFAQALITSIAAYCLYGLACRLYDLRTGLLAALFYICYAEIHSWNFYILPESLFVSMVIVSLFLVVAWRGWWRIAASLLVVLFTSALRPNGIVLIISIGIYVLYSLLRARRYRVFVLVACIFIATSPVVIKIVGGLLSYSPLIERYAQGRIIYGYEPLALKMPGVLPAGLQGMENPFLRIFYFIAEKPWYFLQLAGLKLWYFFLHARPYYSSFHNCFTVLTLVPSYALAAWGLLSRTRHPEGKLLLVSICFFQSLIVALTHTSWDGRFLLVVLPIVFIFSAHGALCALEKGGEWIDAGRKRKTPM